MMQFLTATIHPVKQKWWGLVDWEKQMANFL